MDLLLKDGILYEAVLSARSLSGDPYVAPVGFVKRGNLVEIRAYKNGELSRIISSCNRVALNIAYEPGVFIKTALKREWLYKFNTYEELSLIDDIPLLKKSLGYVILDKVDLEDRGEFFVARYSIREIKVNEKAALEPYTRCYSSLIEFLIYATKIKHIRDPGIRSDYAGKADKVFEVISKTCNEVYMAIAGELRVLVAKWLRS